MPPSHSQADLALHAPARSNTHSSLPPTQHRCLGLWRPCQLRFGMETMAMQPAELVPLHQQLIPSSLAHAFGISPVGTGQRPDGAPSSDAGAPRDSAAVQPPHTRGRDSAGAPSAAAGTTAAGAGVPPPQQQQQQATTAPVPACSAQLEPAGAMACSSGMAVQPQQQPQVTQQQQQLQQQFQQQQQQQQQQLTQPGCSSMVTTSSMSAGYQPGTAAAAMAQAAVMSQLRGFPAAAAYQFAGQKGPLVPYALGPLQGMAGMGMAPMSMFAAQAAEYGTLRQGQGMMEEDGDDTTARALKRPRLVWTPQLHKLFEEAVAKLGLDKAVPKTIMTYMKVEGLTRENVASHLQKYRLSLRKGGEKGDKGGGEEGGGGAEPAAEAGGSASGDGGGGEAGGGEAVSSRADAAGAAAAGSDAAAAGSPAAAAAAAAAAADAAAASPAAGS